jgi:hypothetical protein
VKKKYAVEYSLTFYNTEEIEAESRAEAIKKFRALEKEHGELNALDGYETGYQIESVRAVLPTEPQA